MAQVAAQALEAEMTVSGIGSGSGVEVGGPPPSVRRPNVKALREALQAGDMKAAKEAFAKVYTNAKHLATDAAHDGIGNNLKRLVMAVEAGDISAAQDSLKAINAQRPSTVYAPGQLSGVPKAAASDLASLVRAVRSGDSAAAGQALDQLRDFIKSHFDHQDSPVRIQPFGEVPEVPNPVL